MSKEFVKAPDKKHVSKGWGFEEWLCNNDLYCGKRLHFWKGKRCSFHYHREKDETFYVLSGKVQVYYSVVDCLAEDGSLDVHLCDFDILEEGDTFHVPRLMRHMIVALKESNVIEFSTQHKESDSIRIVKGD